MIIKPKNHNKMNVKGIIKQINETQHFESGFTKRELIVTTPGDYPQHIKIEFIKEKTKLLDQLDVGQIVDVSINIRGNEYNGKFFVNLQGWKIETETTTNPGFMPNNNPHEQQTPDEPQQPQPAPTSNQTDDDLPF